ncbi:MAG: tetratricopeptide repeat protein [Anaerolineae bacterium]|nr:tetratricopeptide repeat protein [Anaerolineae bacterium]
MARSKKYHIIVSGKKIEISEDIYLQHLHSSLVESLDLVASIPIYMALGYPQPVDSGYTLDVLHILESIPEIKYQVKDSEISEIFENFEGTLLTILEINKQMLRFLEDYLPLGYTNETIDFSKIPRWRDNEEFQDLLRKAKESIMIYLQNFEKATNNLGKNNQRLNLESDDFYAGARNKIDILKKLIEDPLKAMREGIEGKSDLQNLNTQKNKPLSNLAVENSQIDDVYHEIKDLIEKVTEKITPGNLKEEIKLLQKAMEIIESKSNINDPLFQELAYRANLEIGMRYEDLTDYGLAVDFYNNAIQVFESTPIALFYRGQAYYRLGDFDQANKDLEIALAMSESHEQFFDSEREGAKETLKAIKNDGS